MSNMALNETISLLGGAVSYLPSWELAANYTGPALQTMGSVAAVAIPFIGSIPLLGGLATTGLSVGGFFCASKIYRYLKHGNVFNNTVDMSALAERGQLRRAHGRDVLMQRLVNAVQQGFGILLGPPGCGKTALVEELACRIANNEIPSLRGARLIRLNLRNAEGGVGAEAGLKNFWYGGVDNCVRQLVEALEKQHGQGKQFILFIDEIQDLLRGNIAVFDSFKEELARKNVKLLGATTDAEIIEKLRNRQGTGAGMARRIQVIQVSAMTKEEAQIVLEKEAGTTFTTKYPGFQIEFDEAALKTVVELSEGQFPGRVLPDRAITLLDDICRYYYDEKSATSKQVKITIQDVMDYLAKMKGVSTKIVERDLRKAQSVQLSQDTFQPTLFPEQIFNAKAPLFLVEESKRFASFFGNHPDEPWMLLRGDSKEMLADVSSQWAESGRTVYRCNLRELSRLANTPEGKKFLKLFLEQNFQNGTPPILVLENFKPGWCTTLYPQESQTLATADLTQAFESSKLGQTLNRGLQQIGINPGEITGGLTATTGTARVAPQEDVPEVVKQLLEFIKKEHIPAVVIESAAEVRMPTEVWKPRVLRPLQLQEMVQWLTAKYETASGQKVPENDPWVVKVVYALYHLKDSSISGSVLDLAARIVNLKARTPDASLLSHFLTVLDGNKSIEEINEVLSLVEREVQTKVFGEIVHNAYSECPDGLKNRLHHLTSSPQLSVLWVNEESSIRRESIMDQMAKGLHNAGQTCTHLNYQQLKAMPASLKALVLEESLPMLRAATVVMLEEEALKDPAVVTLLKSGKYKVVCFRSQPKQKGSTAPSSLMGNVVQQGFDMVKEHLGGVLSQQPEAEKSIFAQELEYVPEVLNKRELRMLIDRRLKDKNVDPSVTPALQNLYMLLARQPEMTTDRVFDRLDKDLECYTQTVDSICQQFQEFYGAELGMGETAVRYTVNPALTSKGYRTWRGFTSILGKGFSILTYPIRKGAWFFGVAGTALGGVFVSSVGAWIRRRFIGF